MYFSPANVIALLLLILTPVMIVTTVVYLILGILKKNDPRFRIKKPVLITLLSTTGFLLIVSGIFFYLLYQAFQILAL